jgi:hypothetical protein
MRRLLLAAVLLAVAVSVKAENVLFIGNSFTHQPVPTGVPGLVHGIAKSKGKDFHCEKVAPGGKDWGFHLTNPETLTAINSRAWDVVVIQNYSTAPTHIGNPQAFQENGQKLFDVISKSSPKAVVVLYETWPRHPENGFYYEVEEGRKFESPRQMMDELREGYAKLYATLKAAHPDRDIRLAKVGTAFEWILAHEPKLPIYGQDYYHAGPNGSYLSALIIYSVMSGDSPLGSTNQVDKIIVEPELARRLQQIAEDNVKEGNS